MSTLSKLLLINFLPVFAGAFSFFVILINIADLFVSIVRYIENDVAFLNILQLQYLFLPQCVVFALPIALLFSVSYSMGMLYSNNETIAIFGSGISLKQFITPLIIIAVFLSVALFLTQNYLAIPLLKDKDTLSQQLLRNQPINLDQSDVNIQTESGRVIYSAGYYDSADNKLTDVTVIIRDENRAILTHIAAEWALWKDEKWQFHEVTYITRLPASDNAESPDFVIEERSVHSQDDVNLLPENFQNQFGEIEEMDIREAWNYVRFLRNSGFPFREQLTKYHERYSFALTPLIVTLLSVAIGGRYRKNILGMSLLVSLSLSIVYYCIQLLSGLLATVGALDSIVGAWAGTLLTGSSAMYLLNKAKT
ncbi:MAG: LptF/LptG family permease, partial [Salinispira sp.]